jgi:hypothetical protein
VAPQLTMALTMLCVAELLAMLFSARIARETSWASPCETPAANKAVVESEAEVRAAAALVAASAEDRLPRRRRWRGLVRSKGRSRREMSEEPVMARVLLAAALIAAVRGRAG